MKFLMIVTLFVLGCLTDTLSDKRRYLKLVWSDEFDYSGEPASNKWAYDLGTGCNDNCGWGNNELQYYTKEATNVRVENGMLILEAKKETIESSAYSSARIATRGKAKWLYGKIEVRAKLPEGKGTWPAIWMLPEDWKYGGWPASGEIDIMEHVGFDQNIIHGTVHTEAFNHGKNTHKGDKIPVNNVHSEFHVYSIEWSEEKIDFLVDGEKYFTFTKLSSDYKEWPFDQPFHLIMNIAVGGNWGGQQGVDESIWPQKMLIDYVRVYQ
jgi:beta-glucanase (GH16 family)